MKIPYNQLHVNGSIAFAARSGQIQTFSLEDGKHISTWKHPDVEKVAEAVKVIEEEQKNETEVPEEAQDEASEDDDGPPAKRQKTTGAEDVSLAKDIGGQEVAAAPEEEQKQGKKPKEVRKRHRVATSKVPDRPVITHLISASDGKYIVAVTGHDKTIWVLEHDGAGNLKKLSQRVMPKRPSGIDIGPDSRIICADKFGDVYSLPLLPEDSSITLSSRPAARKKQALSLEANELTVHSQRNRMALLDQKKELERIASQKQQQPEEEEADQPGFELTLLLGHVSMLTDMTIAERDGKRYILTADRDEHIRVSRYIPQAHVIESYCLGHKDFVCSMIIPATQKEVLISGGGDAELFAWDWLSGELLSKTSVLSLAQEIAPDTSKVAVMRLFSLKYPTESGDLTFILAICEDIKAIFSWQLTAEKVLNHPGVIQLPGNPLDLSVISIANEPPKLLVAIDPSTETSLNSLNLFTLAVNEGRLSTGTVSHFAETAVDTPDLHATEEEVRNLVYGTENLRKQAFLAEEGAEEAATPADQ